MQPAAYACMQVSAGSLQVLLALPVLVQLNVWAFLDDLDGHSTPGTEQAQRKAALRAGLKKLKAWFRSNGRSLICCDKTAYI
jgi:hypothetical protein